MKTFTTIKEAFKNGSGDVFFKKGDSFIATSRHENNFEKMASEGFEWLPYGNIVELAEQQEKGRASVVAVQATVEIKNTVKPVYININLSYNFYDEFPDAYGQNL